MNGMFLESIRANRQDSAPLEQENVKETSSLAAYVIAGPNGAGKTTFSRKFLPDFVHCTHFLNADLIAAGLSPFAPHMQDFRAARLMLTRIKELTASRESFAFETTLSGRGYVRTITELKSAGYEINLFFLWLPNPETAMARVKQRVEMGGHNIPEDVIIRRYWSGLNNLSKLYIPLSDRFFLYNSSLLPPELILENDRNKSMVHDQDKAKQVLDCADRPTPPIPR